MKTKILVLAAVFTLSQFAFPVVSQGQESGYYFCKHTRTRKMVGQPCKADPSLAEKGARKATLWLCKNFNGIPLVKCPAEIKPPGNFIEPAPQRK
jgi:hypothetical protein